MKKRDKMKLLGIVLLILIAITVVITFVLVTRLAHPTKGEETKSLSLADGILSNVYIVENHEGEIIILYQGKQYVAKQTAETEYTGVADVELCDGKIIKIYAKNGGITGILDSYTQDSIQLEGYEAVSCDALLPVYQISDKQKNPDDVRQIAVSDLIIGNSEIELITANGSACAIICREENSVQKVRVLLKNKTEICYPNIYVKCDQACRMNKDTVTAETVLSAKKCLKGKKKKKEIRISPEQNGKLYICNKNGTPLTEGYEGEFILRKEADGYVLINELPIEDYVRYVLPSEMPVSFSYEALKAQAVCARTFVYGQIKNNAYAQYGANLDDTTAFQVYHATAPCETSDNAVYDTQGMVMTYEGKLIDCYYFSTSPGYSENLKLWGKESPGYLKAKNRTMGKNKNLSKKKTFHKFITSQPESYDSDSPYYRWTAEISSKMGMDPEYGRLKKIKIDDRSESGYIRSLTIIFEDGERTYENELDIRSALGKYLTQIELADGSVRTGFQSLPSACFEVKKQKKGTIILTGGGFGHGIGMSQYGADGMGRAGKSWQEILEYYYEGVDIVQK